MDYKKVDNSDIAYFQSLLGGARVLQQNEDIAAYSCDETEDLVYYPELVLKPANTAEISSILSYCNRHHVAVTPRGAGTGLSGGALPVHGGVVLDTGGLNKILHLDKDNFQVTTEPGVITQVLQEHVLAHGLFYPPDPSSRGSCFIGGNVAENSGGPRAVKYGVVKDYVLNIEVVLPNGDIIWTGANVLKNATGYNLTQLMVGSEGTLGIITKIVLRLIPAVQHDVLLLVPFRNAVDACRAVNVIMMAGIQPSALEFMERDALEWTMRYMESHLPLPEDIQAHLLIELDGNDTAALLRDAEMLQDILQPFDTGDIFFADTHEQKQLLWSLRRKVGEAVKSHSVYKEEDTVVPRAELPGLLGKVKELGAEYGFRSVCYGHAGDGNLHVNIIRGEMSNEDWQTRLPQAISRLFQYTVGVGGTLSGEHGIGLVQKGYMDIAFNNIQLNLMKGIKQLFDPNHILNPGKIFP